MLVTIIIIIINYKNNMLWMAYLTQNKEEKDLVQLNSWKLCNKTLKKKKKINIMTNYYLSV